MYSPDTAIEICERIGAGKSLVKVCEELDLAYRTVMTWLAENEDFQRNYAQAREAQADFHADEIIDIADDEHLHPESRRIKIDARKWKAGKMKPKVYGDRTVLSNDPENPVNASPVTVSVTSELVKSIIKQIEDEF